VITVHRDGVPEVPLLMVTNDCLCREEKRKSSAERRAPVPAGGQCFLSAQTEKLFDTAT